MDQLAEVFRKESRSFGRAQDAMNEFAGRKAGGIWSLAAGGSKVAVYFSNSRRAFSGRLFCSNRLEPSKSLLPTSRLVRGNSPLPSSRLPFRISLVTHQPYAPREHAYT